ncbi:divergent polysaccharide deacetylase family protein [Paenibacillus sp. 1P03SA]|uniref:divergent polysaccharide deacetylase family protein n=1 Tax=Paenibacillus sp. 1P03SA TaxID=3132294 RepID=UPI0039A07BF6
MPGIRYRSCRLLAAAVLVAGASLFAGPGGLAAARHDEPPAATVRKAAIIIDDLGNNMKGTDAILDLPFPITAAVMPFLPSSHSDAEKAFGKGHDVIVHLPMEPRSGRKKLARARCDNHRPQRRRDTQTG